jgi:replication factor C subunit 3/5
MSDYGEEMDIDVPSKSSAIHFAAETKGKRSAANLPVEAEDSLPWYVEATCALPLSLPS